MNESACCVTCAAPCAAGNAGLDKAVKRLEPVKKKHPTVSWADLIAYVGAVAIEVCGVVVQALNSFY